MKNWNDVLNYIKANFTNQAFELSDVEVLNYLQNHTIKEFSQYVPWFKKFVITLNELEDERTSTFKIPYEYPEDIIDIEDFIPSVGSSTSGARSGGFFGLGIDSAIGEIFSSASSSYNVDILPYLSLEDPSKITFGTHISKVQKYIPFMIILKVCHRTPATIPTEAYNRFFKPFALADIFILVGRARSKFQSVSTPVGQINLQATELIQQGQATKEQIIQQLLNWRASIPIVTII